MKKLLCILAFCLALPVIADLTPIQEQTLRDLRATLPQFLQDDPGRYSKYLLRPSLVTITNTPTLREAYPIEQEMKQLIATNAPTYGNMVDYAGKTRKEQILLLRSNFNAAVSNAATTADKIKVFNDRDNFKELNDLAVVLDGGIHHPLFLVQTNPITFTFENSGPSPCESLGISKSEISPEVIEKL